MIIDLKDQSLDTAIEFAEHFPKLHSLELSSTIEPSTVQQPHFLVSPSFFLGPSPSKQAFALPSRPVATQY